MEWQRSYIEHALDLGATSGTKTIDLPKSALLSEILLRIKAHNGDNPNKMNYLYTKVNKVEVIVNGSEVVKSLDGEELMALAYLNSRVIPYREVNDEAVGNQWETFPIHFGRFSGDLEYGLDCTKVLNPQLKFTWDTTGLGLDGTSLYSTTTYPTLDLQAIQLLDAPGAFGKGFIKSHEITTWSPTANSAEKRVELPTGKKYRRIMLRCESTQWQLQQALAYTILDLNVGTRQPFKMYTEDWVALMKRKYGAVHTYGRVTLDDTMRSFGFSIGHLHAFASLARTAGRTHSSNGGSGGRLSISAIEVSGGTGVSNTLFQFDAHGDLFLSALELPFADDPNDEFMLDTSKWTDVDLVMEAGASGIASILPNLYIVLEEVIVK